MLVKPRLNELMQRADSKYTLVIVSSKRARRIMEDQDDTHENPVSMALNEIATDQFEWVREQELNPELYDEQQRR